MKRTSILCIAILAASAPATTWAQSGSRTQGSSTTGSSTQSSGSATTSPGSVTQTPGSGSMSGGGSHSVLEQGSAAQAPVAMNGYCPVCIVDMKKWVKGSRNYAVVLDGKTYLFPGQAQKDKFLANTVKYTPALSGDCIVCAVDSRVRKPGSVFHTALHKGRLFMFPSDKEKKTFMQNPAKYENADLVSNGMCVVCRTEMQQEVKGKEQFGTVYGGMRFLFPGADQKMMFLANPKKYMPR